MKYFIENGEPKTLADILADRNKQLFEALEKDYTDILFEIEESKGKKKMGGRITQCFLTEFSKLPLMSLEEYTSLDASDLQAYYTCFMEFIRNYSSLEPPITKPLLASYMRLPLIKFNDLLLKDNDIDLKTTAEMIDSDMDALIFSNAEAGNNNSTATIFRAKVADKGGNMRVISDLPPQQQINIISPELQMQKAMAIANQVGIKGLNGGKK